MLFPWADSFEAAAFEDAAEAELEKDLPPEVKSQQTATLLTEAAKLAHSEPGLDAEVEAAEVERLKRVREEASKLGAGHPAAKSPRIYDVRQRRPVV